MKVGDLVLCEYGSVQGVALVIGCYDHAALIRLASSDFSSAPLWVGREYLEVISASR